MGRHLRQHADQEDDRLVRLRPHGTLAQCWHGGDYHQLVSSWMLPSSSLHRSSCPSALATSSQCLGRWTTMGSTWQSLEDNEDLFLGKRNLKSHPFFFLEMPFGYVFHQTQGLSLSPSSTNRLILPPATFWLRRQASTLGACRCKGRGRWCRCPSIMMQVMMIRWKKKRI